MPLPALPVFRMLVLAVTLAATAALPGAAANGLGAAASLVPNAKLVGEGRLRMLGFKIFDAALYAPAGTYSRTRPFALKLTYLRNFKGKRIAERSADEMKRMGVRDNARLVSWTRQMTAIFPDVSAGSSITGVRDARGRAVFFRGGRKLGTISDAGFADRFFAIWLGPGTNDPALRARLIGAR